MKLCFKSMWLCLVAVSTLQQRHCSTFAFLNSRPIQGRGRARGQQGGSCNNHNGNGGMGPPPPSSNHQGFRHYNNPHQDVFHLWLAKAEEKEECDDDENEVQNDVTMASNNKNRANDIANVGSEIRGGATKVLSGGKSTLTTVTSYWSNAFDKAGKTIAKPFQAVSDQVSSVFESKEKKKDREIMAKLETTKIVAVVVPNTTVVPQEVIQLAARRSGMIGNPLRTDRVQDFAAALKRWYEMRGYILHSVTGATLKTESATAEIQVQEPHISSRPVDITFCKEMVVDEETGNLLTFRQYRERHMKRRTIGARGISKADTNTTFVQTSGKTRPGRIAQALDLHPGRPFKWDPARWRMITSSGVFGRVLQASPTRMRDGTVQLQILATEAPPRHLEYGVSKSLYTGSWEGEIDFQHENLLGGGETLGVMVRRGAKDPEPSVRLSFRDDKFGMPGGYDVEAFREFIGENSAFNSGSSKKGQGSADGKGPAAGYEPVSSSENTVDPDRMLDRRGVKFTYRNPISPNRIRFSRLSTSVERTATQGGIREAIGSGTLALGPFRRQLPLQARSSVDGSVCSGIRVPENAPREDTSSTSYRGLTLLPYTSVTLSTTQVLPLLPESDDFPRQPSIALRHSLSASTRNLPRHEQNAIGYSSMIRGGSPNGRISTAITGVAELRVPLEGDIGIPGLKNVLDRSSLVLFGDWVSARKNNGSPFFSERSIGFGIRKLTQGIPLKVDFSYAGNGKIKSSFGLGRDFDV